MSLHAGQIGFPVTASQCSESPTGLPAETRLPLAVKLTDHRPEVQADLRGAQMLPPQQPLQSRQADLPLDANEAWPDESCHLGLGGHPSKF